MSERSRRGFFKTAGLATTGLALGRLSTGLAAEGATRPDFMHPIKPGQVFTSLDDARRASLQADDVVLVRDLSKLAPAHVWSEPFVRGKWHLRPYQLADGQSGKMLMVCDFAGDEGHLGFLAVGFGARMLFVAAADSTERSTDAGVPRGRRRPIH